jgi:hypothetical protein
MKAKLLTIAAVNAAILALGSSAFAQISYDQSVNTLAGQHGTFYGSGNNNGNWAVVNDTTDNIQLGLRGKVSGANTYPDSGNGIYVFNEGVSPLSSSHYTWNFDFSISANADGTGNASIGSYTYKLLVDSDPGAGDNFTTVDDLLLAYGDNEFAKSGVAGKNVNNTDPAHLNIVNPLLEDEVQNSENAKFGLPAGYNPNATGQYDIILEVFGADGTTMLATDEIQIDVVPEVSYTLPLFGAAVLGLAFVSRKVKVTA